MKERILFVGVGQCGNNIAYEFEKMNYLAFHINSSNADLMAINGKEKYHIPAAFGCNKDRKKAVNYAKEYWKTITDVIDSKFPMQDLVFFCFSLGGGTGSGISPSLIEIIASKNLSKHYGAIIVLPDLNESVKTIRNALECYKQITDIEMLKNIYILDNSNEDKFRINKIFISRFDAMINSTNPDSRGIIDESELETMLTCKGAAVIEEFITPDKFKENIFTPYSSGCEYLAFTTTNRLNYRDFYYKVGTPKDIFYGFNDENNLLMATGIQFPKNRINDLLSGMDKERPFNTINKINYNIPEEQVSKKEVKLKTVDDIFSKYL